MKRVFARTNFNGSRLTRFLADLSIVSAVDSKQAFAERFGEWLDLSDAITLHGAHNAGIENLLVAQSGEQSVENAAIEDEFARTRTALVDSITESCSPNGSETGMRLPQPKPGVAIELATSFGPYHRFYLAHQGDMELSIRQLRANVRQALSKVSARLGRLAILDASLDKILWARERQLLSTVPLLLEKRFEQVLKAHQQSLIGTRKEDDPALWMQKRGWLAEFCRELQAVLLAELDLRLEPTVGLIEAFSNETNRHK